MSSLRATEWWTCFCLVKVKGPEAKREHLAHVHGLKGGGNTSKPPRPQMMNYKKIWSLDTR